MNVFNHVSEILFRMIIKNGQNFKFSNFITNVCRGKTLSSIYFNHFCTQLSFNGFRMAFRAPNKNLVFVNLIKTPSIINTINQYSDSPVRRK